jgi:hypothetical protein
MLTDPQVAEDNNIVVFFINGDKPNVSHPVKRNLKGILELLKELSGKEWCYLEIAGCQGDFCHADGLSSLRGVKNTLSKPRKRHEGIWMITFSRPEGRGSIVALSEQIIATL